MPPNRMPPDPRLRSLTPCVHGCSASGADPATNFMQSAVKMWGAGRSDGMLDRCRKNVDFKAIWDDWLFPLGRRTVVANIPAARQYMAPAGPWSEPPRPAGIGGAPAAIFGCAGKQTFVLERNRKMLTKDFSSATNALITPQRAERTTSGWQNPHLEQDKMSSLAPLRLALSHVRARKAGDSFCGRAPPPDH